MFMKCIPPHTPLLYGKTGVCRGITIFLIFAPKHRLWVLVITCTHNLCFEQKYQKFSTENFHYIKLLKSLYIAWACLRNAFVD